MLECQNMDIFPLSQGGYELDETSEDRRAVLFKDVEEEGWCLFSIDVRNTYGLPFEVSLDRVQQSEETFFGEKPLSYGFYLQVHPRHRLAASSRREPRYGTLLLSCAVSLN